MMKKGIALKIRGDCVVDFPFHVRSESLGLTPVTPVRCAVEMLAGRKERVKSRVTPCFSHRHLGSPAKN